MAQLDEVERALHATAVQVQSYRAMLSETESALQALGEDAYRIIGDLMVKVQASDLKAELTQKRDALATRLAAIEKQEQKLRSELQRLQEEALGEKNEV